MDRQSTTYGIFVIAFVSAVLNFAGLSQLIDPGDWWLKTLCALTGVAVWISLYLFWSYAFAIVPELKLPGKRLASWGTVLGGCAVILCLSTYWNLIAFVGGEVQKLALVDTQRRAELVLANAIESSGTFASITPQIDSLAIHIESLADGEEKDGTITGSPGPGGVANTLRQIKSKVEATARSVEAAAQSVQKLKSKGQTCLAALRRNLSAQGLSPERSNNVATQVDCVNEVVAALGNQKIASALSHALRGLTSGIVVPVTVRRPRQKQAVQNAIAGLQRQADSIAKAAAEVRAPPVKPLSVERPNTMLAVLLYWRSVIPAIATASALDLLPLILLIFRVLRYRDADERDEPRHPWTAKELLDAQDQLERLRGGTTPPKPPPKRRPRSTSSTKKEPPK